MINPIHIIGILSLLAGWHLDAIDRALIEENREALKVLNIPTEQPPLIDTENHHPSPMHTPTHCPPGHTDTVGTAGEDATVAKPLSLGAYA